ncbi:hypothetical protein D3C81_1477690 [compost metagenome]
MPDQVARRTGVLGRQHYAQAYPHLHDMPFDLNGAFDRLDHAHAESVHVLVIAWPGQYNDELVASQTGDQITVTGNLAEADRYLQQHRVAGRMPKAIVDRLEVVQIQHQQRHLGLVGARSRLLEETEQLVAIRQAGQGVVQREVLDLGMGGHFVGDVAASATKAGTDALGHDRARSDPADTLLAEMVLVLAAQRAGRACRGQAVQAGAEVIGITR